MTVEFNPDSYRYILEVKKTEKNGDVVMFNEFFSNGISLREYLKRVYGIEKEFKFDRNYTIMRNETQYIFNVTFKENNTTSTTPTIE